MISYYFSDIDGTLIHSDGRIGRRTQLAIRQCSAPFSLVSARAPFEMQPLVEALQLQGPQIAFNGALTFEQTHILSRLPLTAKTLATIIKTYKQRFQSNGVCCALYGAGAWFAQAPDASTRAQTALTGIAPHYQPLKRVAVPIYKVMFYCTDPLILAQLTSFYQQLPNSGFQAARSGRYWLELTHAKANKAKALLAILARHQLQGKDAAAFGDSENDLPMLKAVGHGFAMGNAPLAIQQAADVVTASNDDDGIAAVLDHLQ